MVRRLVSASLCTLPLLLCAHAVLAQGTKLWSESKFDEFERGRPEGVAVSSDGHLAAGQTVRSVFTSASTYVWSVAADKAGNAYLGTGSPATVLRVTPDGKSTTLFSTKDLSVQVVRVGPDGAIYAATLPSGKVYKLAADAKDLDEDKAQVVFDPSQTEGKPKYIWDMAFDPAGKLFVATGSPAAIYRIDPARPSKTELFFSSDEEHIRALAFAPDGNLIAGTDGTGLVYRIGIDGKGFVLFNAPKREITSIAIGANGAIYAAAVGEKGHSTLPPLPVQGTANVTATITIVQPGSVQAFNGNTVIPDGSEVYEIAPNGTPRRLWAGHDDVVYALRATPEGLLAATGNRGRIYRIQEDGNYADLAHLEAGQAVGFADAPNALYVGASNTGRLFALDHGTASSGTFLSDVFDAGFSSQWGRAEIDNGPGSAASNYELYARVGNVDNPERGWTEWKKVTPDNGNLGLEPARFVQWKAVLHPGASIGSVGINYLPVNMAPVLDEIVIAPGVRINSAAMQPQQPQPAVVNLPSTQNNTINFNQDPGKEPLAGIKDKTAVTVRWAAHDDNGDDLVFAVYYRGDGESNWQLLKGDLTDRWYSFDAALLPDGPYRLKVVASDSPSHPPGEQLTGDRTSDRFLIDTTPPVLTAMKAQMMNGAIHAVLTATDQAIPIAHAEYSIDAGPWQYLNPVGKLSDSLVEHYDFMATLARPKEKALTPANPEEHVLTVRVYDRYDNVSAAKTVVR